jgi:hypothetical protein
MAADIRIQYPSTSTTALTNGLASLATDANLLAGWECGAVDNTTFEDLDHLVSGIITVGTTPTANTLIQVWAYSYHIITTGTPTYPDVLDGTSSAETLTNTGVKFALMKLVASIDVIATTSNVGYYFPPTSIANLFGALPQFWGIFVVHNTGVNLNSTAGNHVIHYNRIQAQTV